MLRLFYSNRTEALLESLAGEVETARVARPFAPIRLVVPSGHVATYVKLGMAARHGIAANVHHTFLERCFVDLVAARYPEHTVVTGAVLRGFVLSLFSDAARLHHAELEPVRRYLDAAGPGDALERRRVQLALHVSRLFEEYGFSRPELLQGWREGTASGTIGGVEQWQRRLWLDVFGAEGLVTSQWGPEGEKWFSLPRVLDQIDILAQVPAEPLHLFGFSYFARAFHDALARLSQHAEVRVYALNPCREYWEDLETDRERKRRAKRGSEPAWSSLFEDPYALTSSDSDMPLLASWGRPGREAVHLLNHLSDCTFEDRFVSAGAAASELGRIQDGLLNRSLSPDALRSADGDGCAATADGSFQVLSCPDVRREAEVIAAEIWRLVQASEQSEHPLRFNEIGVIVNGTRYAEYLPHLRSAFDECYRLPHQIADLPATGESRVAEAFELLLDLPFSTFTRRDVLTRMVHPVVLARFPDVTRDDCVELAVAAGILHGADRHDHADTYIEGDLLNWDQGIRRAALGCVAYTDTEPADAAVSDAAMVDPGGRSLDTIARFGLLARSLIADARFMQHQCLALDGWADLLSDLASSYLVPTSSADEQALLRCLRAVDSLRAFDVSGAAVSYRVAAELLRRELNEGERSQGHYLAHGVVVSSFVPMRAIPFRVVFLVGLGEGSFPAQESLDALDLRQQRRQAGDVTPRERDLYMLLETLLCARERLYVSYVCRDALTGESIAPAAPVQELLETWRALAPGVSPKAWVREFPLQRHETPHDAAREVAAGGRSGQRPFDVRPPEVEAEARSVALRRALQQHCDARQPDEVPTLLPSRLDLAQLQAQLDAETWGKLSVQLARPLLPGPDMVEADGSLSLSLHDVRQFLECPLQGFARTRLGLQSEDTEDDIEQEEEQFDASGLQRASLLRHTFVTALHREVSFADAYAQEARRLERQGALPSGMLGRLLQARHLQILEHWSECLMRTGLQRGGLETHRFGSPWSIQASAEQETERLHDPLEIEVPRPGGASGRSVRLQGRTGVWCREPRASLVLLPRAVQPKALRPRDIVRAFVEHAAYTATGGSESQPHSLHVCGSDGSSGHMVSYRFAPWSAEEARAWLGNVVQDLLEGPHIYLLPCEAVLEAYAPWKSTRKPLHTTIRSLVERAGQDGGSFSSLFGPVPHAERYPLLPQEALERMVERRFGPLLAALELLDEASL